MAQEDTGKLLAEYETMRNLVESTRQNLEILTASIMEMEGVKEALQQLKDAEGGSEVYVPLGGDSFIKARLEETDRVIQGIGADVAVKKTVPEALTSLEERIKRLEGLREEQTRRINSALSRLEELTPELQALAAQVQGQGR